MAPAILPHAAERRLSSHKGGRRLWLEGKRLRDIGFDAGVRYQSSVAGDVLTLRLTPSGDHKVSHKQGRPVVDLITRELGDVERVEVAFTPGAVYVSVHHLDQATQERLGRLQSRLATGQSLRLGSICHGGGVASDALLRGLGNAEMAWAVERDSSYLGQSLEHGPLQTGGTTFEYDLGNVDPNALGTVDVIEAGLPCVSASRAGKAKKGLKRQEDEDATADLAVSFLEIIRATQPAVVLLENVPEYASSATANIIRARLRRFGYVVHEAIVDGAAWSLEARKRWVLLAVTRGLDVDLASLQPRREHTTLGEIVDAKAGGWKSLAAMQRKAARDAANGNGFSRGRRVLQADATSVPTLRRGYQKGGSCDVRLAHPTRPGMARLFTAAEHAAIKGIPPALVEGLSQKKAHEVLGQSVISPAFRGLGELIAQASAA